jgi:hypothetical protein
MARQVVTPWKTNLLSPLAIIDLPEETPEQQYNK